MPDYVYKVEGAAVFERAVREGAYTGAAIDQKDGFIHLSTAVQLPETLRLHFRGQGALLLIALRTADLGPGLKWEKSRGGDLFPHLYGRFDFHAVAWTAPIDVDADGNCVLPERLG
jgi:uncharacterized protein (DUF952 family)